MRGESSRRFVRVVPAVPARAGLVDRHKPRKAMDPAAPVMVTAGLCIPLGLVDFLMIGIAPGDAAIAGLERGFRYCFHSFGLSFAVSPDMISVVSRRQGGDRPDRADLAVNSRCGRRS